jgi:hypothetical protein
MPLQFSRQALLLAALVAEVARLRDGVHGRQHNETPLLGCCSNCSAVARRPGPAAASRKS